MATKHKLNIFEILNSINVKNRGFYDSLSIEEQKTLQPVVLMKWMGGIVNEQQIIILNQFINKWVFSLSGHKTLLMDILIASSPGRRTRYTWNKRKSAKSNSLPICVTIIKTAYNYNYTKAVDSLSLLSNDDILTMAQQQGLQLPEIKDLKKELRARIK